MIEFEKCFIMLCTNRTEKECLDLNLFGDKDWRLQYLKEIKTGDIGMLLNLSKNELIGTFKARSEPQLNIEPEAWAGEFPAQVRVEPIGKIQRISNAASILEKIGLKMTKLPSGAPVPQFPVYGRDIVEKILTHFREPIPIERKILPRKELKSIIPSKLKFDDVVGLDDVKSFIKKRMVEPVVDLETAQKYYLRLGGGLLLYGPPGAGKTLVAQATATEIDAQFVELSPSIIRGYPGDPEKKIEELFQNLLMVPRAVVFLDEAEALLSTRDSQTSTVMHRITPILLSQFAKLSRHRFKPILVIAATNMPWRIDNAFLRPGRLDKVLYVGLPNQNDRICLLRHFLEKRTTDCVDSNLYKEEHLRELANELEGYSCADIEQIIDEAALEAFNQEKRITHEMIEEIIKVRLRSVNEEQLRKYKEWGKRYGNVA
ncbi:MAG: AAA family ATPase [Candidatus Hodarchaeales archaeon]